MDIYTIQATRCKLSCRLGSADNFHFWLDLPPGCHCSKMGVSAYHSKSLILSVTPLSPSVTWLFRRPTRRYKTVIKRRSVFYSVTCIVHRRPMKGTQRLNRGERLRRSMRLFFIFYYESLELRASCRDDELEVDHRILYVVRYIRPQLPSQINKLVPHTDQVL